MLSSVVPMTKKEKKYTINVMYINDINWVHNQSMRFVTLVLRMSIFLASEPLHTRQHLRGNSQHQQVVFPAPFLQIKRLSEHNHLSEELRNSLIRHTRPGLHTYTSRIGISHFTQINRSRVGKFGKVMARLFSKLNYFDVAL